jgi:hypothetical protein
MTGYGRTRKYSSSHTDSYNALGKGADHQAERCVKKFRPASLLPDIPVIFLVFQDRLDGIICLPIMLHFQIDELPIQVIHNDRFHSQRASHNAGFTEQCRDEPHNPATQAAKPIAFAFRAISTLDLGPENVQVPLFVREEMLKDWNIAAAKQLRYQYLRAVYIDRTKFASVIYLKDFLWRI